jgi:hypothetical protein
LAYFGATLAGSILVVGAIGFVASNEKGPPIGFVKAASTSTSSLTVGNAVPTVSLVSVNGGSAITLTPNATTAVLVSITISDNNGCGDVFYRGNVTTTLYRSGVSTTCAVANPGNSTLNTLNCYVIATTTHNCPNPTSTTVTANATATFEVYYFAQATDASSSYPNEGWQAFVEARDASNTTANNSSTAVELNSLIAFALTSSTLNYGTITPGTNTSSTNQISTVKNAGNASATLRINGSALVSGTNSIATSAQHYATGTFTYGGAEQALQSAATDVAGFLISRPPLAAWTTTTAMPSVRMRQATAVVTVGTSTYIYAIAGTTSNAASGATSSVMVAPINSDGTLGSWSFTNGHPTGTRNGGGAAYNSYIYYFGGSDVLSVLTSTVRYGAVSQTGTVVWGVTTALPTALESMDAIAYNGYLYSVGGESPTEVTSSVLFAPIGATGTIGTWSSTTPLPAVRSGARVAVINGYLYAVAGANSSGRTSSTYVARVNATGSVGSWSLTRSLPNILAGHGIAADNGILHIFGGDIAAGIEITSTTFAVAGADGLLSSWSLTSDLPNDIQSHGYATHNGYAYALGGRNGGVQSTVYFTPLATRNVYWGVAVSSTQAAGSYSSTITYTEVFSP